VPERVRVGLVERLDALLEAQRESPEGIDCHPGSDGQVRNFVDPSPHAVYGWRTRTIVDELTDRVAQLTTQRGVPQGPPVDDRPEFDEVTPSFSSTSPHTRRLSGRKNVGRGDRGGENREGTGHDDALSVGSSNAAEGHEPPEAEELIPAAIAFGASVRRDCLCWQGQRGGGGIRDPAELTDQSPEGSTGSTTLGIRDYELGAFGSLATVSTTRRGYEDWIPTFQCLPAEVAIGLDGTATLTSAIPGLHVVDDAGIYAGLQKVLQRALPSLEMVLTDLSFGVQDELVAGGSEYTSMQTRKSGRAGHARHRARQRQNAGSHQRDASTQLRSAAHSPRCRVRGPARSSSADNHQGVADPLEARRALHWG
jgi:hypothetical protein